MNLIPDEKLKPNLSLNMAPMIDFLFILLSFFATLAVMRAVLFDSELDLVSLNRQSENRILKPTTEKYQINISISPEGKYKWITDVHDYPMRSVEKIKKEILYQHKNKILPEDKALTEIFLHVDRKAPWESIAKLIYSVKEMGFSVYPVYQLDDSLIAETKTPSNPIVK